MALDPRPHTLLMLAVFAIDGIIHEIWVDSDRGVTTTIVDLIALAELILF